MKKRILALLLVLAMLCAAGTTALAADNGGGQQGGGQPGGGGSGNTVSVTTTRCTEGPWSFVLSVAGEERTVTITGWDKSDAEETVIVPAILGGGQVTAIASTAFSATHEVKAVYLPQTVETIADFAFYDLNSLRFISCANPDVVIDGQALASCNGQEIVTSGTSVKVNVVNPEAAAIAGGSYLNGGTKYDISVSDIAAISQGDCTVSSTAITFSGDAYKPESATKEVEIAKSLKDQVSKDDFRYTFRNLSDEKDAEAFQEELASGAWASIMVGLDYSAGYYLNGEKVSVAKDCKAIDAATGEELAGIVSTGLTYTYVAYRDEDDDGAIDVLYYTDGTSDFVAAALSQNAKIYAPDTLMDSKDSASSVTGKYLAFANGVVEAEGRSDEQSYDQLVIENTTDSTYTCDGEETAADAVLAEGNMERSLLWANNYSVIETKYLYGVSTSTASWAKETLEAGDSSYNYELNMNYGLNAGLYATNGGQLKVGDPDGKRSYIRTSGDTGNGVIAIGGGAEVGEKDAPYPTAQVYVYNTIFWCQGWNSHVADAIYGGYIYLENVKGTTGMPGSYLGQSSALANDFGAGTVEAVDCDFITYGNGSAGAYVIGQGSGTIKATNTNFTSNLDSGLCSAGGEFDITGGSVKGIIGFRARANGADSVLTDVALTKADVNTNYAKYVTDLDGSASAAAAAWSEATGDSGMPGPALSNQIVGLKGATIGDLCDAYEIDGADRTALYEKLSDIAGKAYTDGTAWRASLLDSDRYGHPIAGVGKLTTAGTDYSEAPYLNNGVGAEGLQTSSIIEYQQAQLGVTLNNCTVSYEGDGNYNYLIASESAACAEVTFNDCSDLSGIIWNEGNKTSTGSGVNLGNSDAGGTTGSSGNYGVVVQFNGSSFSGCFADGDYGLWEVDGLSYTNGAGVTSSLNGNYYSAAANWGNCASFDKNSVWTVTGDSYLGSLTLAGDETITAAAGSSLEIYVDVDDSFDVSTGTKVSSLKAGTYEHVVILVK